MSYRFETSFAPVSTMRLKIEINTREHFSVMGITRRAFTVHNPRFDGTTELPVYHFDELLGTKVRALYQRKKGRDLYDLWIALVSARPTAVGLSSASSTTWVAMKPLCLAPSLRRTLPQNLQAMSFSKICAR